MGQMPNDLPGLLHLNMQIPQQNMGMMNGGFNQQQLQQMQQQMMMGQGMDGMMGMPQQQQQQQMQQQPQVQQQQQQFPNQRQRESTISVMPTRTDGLVENSRPPAGPGSEAADDQVKQEEPDVSRSLLAWCDADQTGSFGYGQSGRSG
jgi:transcription initiation factor TFIID subunit TAF12